MSTTYTYVACRDEGSIEAYVLDDAEGRLNRFAVVEGLEDVAMLAMDHRRGILYAGQGGASHEHPLLWVFTVVAGGRLVLRGTAHLPCSAAYLEFDPTSGDEHPAVAGSVGRDGLLGASYFGDAVFRVMLDSQGLPQEGQPAWIDDAAGRGMRCVVPSPDGRHVYATSLVDDRVVIYRRGATGEPPLVRSGTVNAPAGSGPRHVMVHPEGTHVALLTELSGEILTFHRDAETGELAEFARVRVDEPEDELAPGYVRGEGCGPLRIDGDEHSDADEQDSGLPERPMWAAGLMHARGANYILATERTTSALTVFDTGSQPRRRARTRTEERPRAAAVAPGRELVLVAGELSGHISVYRITEHGILNPTQRVATGARPAAFEFYRK